MLKKTALSLFLLFAAIAKADDYQTDPLSASQGKICVVSTFDEGDYFTVFSSSGAPLWEIPFSSKILSWKIDGGHLYIFSKMRSGKAYFLSCFETQKGELQWEKPIVAPQAPTDMPTDMPMMETTIFDTPSETAPE